MPQFITRWTPILGAVAAMALLAISTYRYAGDVHWTRVTVSLICAPNLPDGSYNSGRELPIAALLLLCTSMSILFELISRAADSSGVRKTIQIAGIGSMVYALLTATPMHNLMVNIALAFFFVAICAIMYMLYRRQRFVLAIAGLACIVLKFVSVSLYYTSTFVEIWGMLQKLSFILTTTWLFTVHLQAQPRINHEKINEAKKHPAAN